MGGGRAGKPTHAEFWKTSGPRVVLPPRGGGGVFDPTLPPTHPTVQLGNRTKARRALGLMCSQTASKIYSVQGTLSGAKLRGCPANLVLLRKRWGDNKRVISYNEQTERRNTVP